MRQKYYLYLFIFVLVVLVAFFLGRNQKSLVSSLPASFKTTIQKDNLPEPTSVSSTENYAPSEEAPAQKAKLGLCGVPRTPDTYLLPLGVYQHFKRNRPEYFALPARHAHCLPQSGKVRFRIVSYDVSSDRAFQYWGDFEAVLRFDRKVSSLVELSGQAEFNKSNLGYRTGEFALKSLVTIGTEVNEPIYLYQLRGMGSAIPRNPIGSYSFYPGLKVLNHSEWDKQFKNGDLTVVDLRVGKSAGENIPSATHLPLFVSFKDLPILDPNQTETIYQTKIKTLPSFSPNRPLVLVGSSGEDKIPYNAAQIFMSAGYNNLAVLAEGYQTLSNTTRATPNSFSSVSRLSPIQLPFQVKSALIIDTRFRTDGESVTLRNIWRAPLLLNPLFNYSETSARGKVDVSTLNFQEIKAQAKGKKIILIGGNDYDWAPLILAEKMAENGITNIQWLREGFEGLEIYKKLGLFDLNFAKEIRKQTQFIYKKTQKKQNLAPVIIIERKKQTQKSFQSKPQPQPQTPKK